MIRYNDLREWAQEAAEIGELKLVENADPKYEMGAIVQFNSSNYGPAIMFDKIQGCNPGFRVMTNCMSNIRTFNLTFGFPPGNTIRESLELLKGKLGQYVSESSKFPPKAVKSAPILENIEESDKIDLGKFPAVVWHELDAGPYIGTGCCIITRDPDTGQVNVGTYRSQLFDKNTVGFYISPGKDGRLHRDKYFSRGQPCPVVMVFGSDPLLFAISGTETPVSEFEFVGAMRGESIPVVEGKVTGLPIPANAEIAIEGFSDLNDTLMEGPYGEWTGTYASIARHEPFLKPTVLYYRNDPIMLGSPAAKGAGAEQVFYRAIWRSALVWEQIEQSGLPNIKGVWCAPEGGTRQLVIVSIEQAFPGHATAVGHVTSQCKSGAYLGKYVVVVDDDINPYDIADVLWAVCTRSEPAEIDIVSRAWSGPLDPRIRKPTDSFHNSRGIIYAVKPYEWYREYPPTVTASEGLLRHVVDKWGGLFGDKWQSY